MNWEGKAGSGWTGPLARNVNRLLTWGSGTNFGLASGLLYRECPASILFLRQCADSHLERLGSEAQITGKYFTGRTQGRKQNWCFWLTGCPRTLSRVIFLTLWNPWTLGNQEESLKSEICGNPASFLATPRGGKHRPSRTLHFKSTSHRDVCSEVAAVVYQPYATFSCQCWELPSPSAKQTAGQRPGQRDHRHPPQKLGNFIPRRKYQISTAKFFFISFFGNQAQRKINIFISL